MSLIIKNTKNEIVGIYDENDNYIKAATRKELREQNLIHRCCNILVINSENKLLVQTRSMSKEYCPGYLDACVGGVLGDKEDILISAQREVDEEIGIDVNKTKDKLKFFGKMYFEDAICKCWEYNYVLHLTKEEEKLITFKDHEVSSIQWMTKDELEKIIKEKNINITGDSVLSFKMLVDKNLFI